MWRNACRRLLYPPDLGSEGKEVVDLETEAREAVGLYIKRDEFPDRLFAPPKRTTFMEEGANPIYDKEMRSEIFSQGTLMLRLVIQISMLLALFVMAVCLYIWPQYAPWYISYVLLFNMLVGPVFSAGSVTSERERQTLDLLLVTLVTPWQMLWGKLLSGLRVSSVLTSFLLWPVLLACVMPLPFWYNLPTMAGYLLIVALTCVTTAMTALFCSTIFQKSATSLIATYLIIVVMFMAPLAMAFFAETFFRGTSGAALVDKLGVLSPFAARFRAAARRVARRRQHGRGDGRRSAAVLRLHRLVDSVQRRAGVGDDAAVSGALARGGLRYAVSGVRCRKTVI